MRWWEKWKAEELRQTERGGKMIQKGERTKMRAKRPKGGEKKRISSQACFHL